jgi:hypothetical protein
MTMTLLVSREKLRKPLKNDRLWYLSEELG